MSENRVFHPADSRGLADHGWLVSRHTFSFADYYNPQRMNFGLLRVLNDDIVQPDMGFGIHPHENMEIVSIPLSGALWHADSMGNKGVVTPGEVQVMSAGSGLTHSEYNDSDRNSLNFLQIWVFPKEKNIAPRYGQKRFEANKRVGRFQTLVSPVPSDKTIWINQDAWFSLANIQAGLTVTYEMHTAANGVYYFLIEGKVAIADQELNRRDGLGLAGSDHVRIQAGSDSQLLAIEVPMKG